jgi:hypothetical protein
MLSNRYMFNNVDFSQSVKQLSKTQTLWSNRKSRFCMYTCLMMYCAKPISWILYTMLSAASPAVSEDRVATQTHDVTAIRRDTTKSTLMHNHFVAQIKAYIALPFSSKSFNIVRSKTSTASSERMTSNPDLDATKWAKIGDLDIASVRLKLREVEVYT